MRGVIRFCAFCDVWRDGRQLLFGNEGAKGKKGRKAGSGLRQLRADFDPNKETTGPSPSSMFMPTHQVRWRVNLKGRECSVNYVASALVSALVRCERASAASERSVRVSLTLLLHS